MYRKELSGGGIVFPKYLLFVDDEQLSENDARTSMPSIKPNIAIRRNVIIKSLKPSETCSVNATPLPDIVIHWPIAVYAHLLQ